MIAKSDLVILVVSSTLLGIAVYRWDQNTRNVDTSTVLANTQVAAPAADADSSAELNATTSASSTPSADQIADDANEVGVDSPTIVVPTEPLVVEPAVTFLVHEVRSGDSLSEIAVLYNTSVQELSLIHI